MSKSNKLIFFGNERLATATTTTAPTLRALVHAGYQVAAVVVHHNPSISRKSRGLEIVDVAHAYHIPVLMPEKLDDISDRLKTSGAQAAVLVAYGKIIPQNIIDIFPKGIINIHPSLLPQYRGPTPVETVITDGSKQTGVSLMALSAKMDAGPVYAQEKSSLNGAETKPWLATKLSDIGSELLINNLAAIMDGSLQPQPQDNNLATYTKLLKKEDGLIDWGRAAEVYERQIRAYLEFPKSRGKIFDHEVVITKARVAKTADDGTLVIACKPDFLEVLELTAPSGRTVSGEEFIRGYKKF